MKRIRSRRFGYVVILLIGTGAGYLFYGPGGAAYFAVTWSFISMVSWSERYD